MAETTRTTSVTQGTRPEIPTETPKNAGPSKPRGPSRFEQLNKLYALPAPLRTFPLPTFVPHNPLSLFHILYVWVSQSMKPESSQFDPVYQGWFSPETRSVHVTDTRSIRGLWEQGFYGKGTLSRSEPSWHNREKTRLGTRTKQTSEEVTRARRAERQAMKWERARKEREAIDQKLLEEAEPALQPKESPVVELVMQKESGPPIVESVFSMEPAHVDPPQLFVDTETTTVQTSLAVAAPVGPLELLALPNSQADLESLTTNTVACFAEDFDQTFVQRFYAPPVGPLELLALPNSIKSYPTFSSSPSDTQDVIQDAVPKAPLNGHVVSGREIIPLSKAKLQDEQATTDTPKFSDHSQLEEPEIVGGSETNDETAEGSIHSEQTTETNETGSTPTNGPSSTTQIKRRKSVRFSPTVEKNTFIQTEPPSPERAAVVPTIEEEPLVIKNQEHAQLTLEEAFFLSYALGALEVLDPETKLPVSNEDLFALCRKTSCFPPQATPSLSPDDPFMVNYVVYHHFRSLGWVPRSGIKFSVDYVLYTRGPVFTHAEFCVLLLPSYTDPYWHSSPFLENYVKGKEKRTWHWMHCINRVVTQIKKTLILTYVDIPKPISEEEERKLGIHGVLARYKVREVVMKRFSANRMRD